VIVLIPSAAHAAWDIPISGTTSSGSNIWYTSANYRTVTNDHGGEVWINIDSYPKLSNGAADQLKWRLRVGEIDTSTEYLWRDGTYWEYITWYSIGTQFRNRFARYTDCPNCNHNFTGNMTY
jgi:hypothetical protein